MRAFMFCLMCSSTDSRQTSTHNLNWFYFQKYTISRAKLQSGLKCFMWTQLKFFVWIFRSRFLIFLNFFETFKSIFDFRWSHRGWIFIWTSFSTFWSFFILSKLVYLFTNKHHVHFEQTLINSMKVITWDHAFDAQISPSSFLEQENFIKIWVQRKKLVWKIFCFLLGKTKSFFWLQTIRDETVDFIVWGTWRRKQKKMKTNWLLRMI